MALSKLSGDEQRIVFSQLCNPLDPGVAVAFSSASSELRELTQAERQQLQADYEAATALSRKAGKQSCKELHEAKKVEWYCNSLTADELKLLGTLISVLPALETLVLCVVLAAGPDGVQRLVKKLGAGALPAMTRLQLLCTHVGDAGASALAAALSRGAMPRLKSLVPASATRGWWPSRRPCGGGPRWSISICAATRLATRALPPSWRRLRRQLRCDRRQEMC